MTGHLRDEDGQEHTWTLSILRHHDAQDPATGPGYCLCVTHHSPAGLNYGTWITPTALRVVRQALEGGQAMDPRVRTALSEALAQGPLLPDRLLRQPVTEADGGLDITVGDLAALRREEDGTFRVSFREQAQFDLVLAGITAILAGADEPQLAAISRYFEDVGIAYQISDDVIDLYGQVSPDEYRQGITVRSPAEDLATGTVTYPVAHATGLLDETDRRCLRTALNAHTDAGAIEASHLLMHNGALDVCLTEARELVDHAWHTLDPLVPPTLHKAMVRALGWYAAQRVSEYDPHAPDRPTSSLSHTTSR
ncbi:polyprenyl synthetase family protein [Streptomyces sp. NPDC005899]|uniref:polyprenyl synthetase family protein n=1 Tax=Streptomyces sp. NPDC005899 TaxID=3155716 RepID=UPI0033F87EC7